MRLPLIGALLLTGTLGLVASTTTLASEPDDLAARAKEAIERALPYLAQEGARWIDQRKCISCHQVSFMLWGFHEARAHGIAVDEQKLAEWDNWSAAASLKARTWFKLTEASLKTLTEAKLAEETLAKLKSLVDQPFETEAEFTAALEKTLLPEQLAAHRETVVKLARLDRKGAVNDGGGLDTLGQLLLASFGREGHTASDAVKTFVRQTPALMARWQEADGRWKAAGQLPGRQWDKEVNEADQTTTLWAALALAGYQAAEAPPEAKAALDRALKYLDPMKKPAGVEWLAARHLLANQRGESEIAQETRSALLKAQNDDGGWGIKAGAPSQAFSTGQAIYALRRGGVVSHDPAMERAANYLIASQTKGVWSVPPEQITATTGTPRLKRLEPIYAYWGTAWGTIGLAQMIEP